MNKLITENKILSDKEKEILFSKIKEYLIEGKKNNDIYDTIKKDIKRFLTPESLHKFIKENINSINEKYLHAGKDKNTLNQFCNDKQNALIEELKKKENKNYNKLIEDIKNWEDLNLLIDEYYNEIYRNIQELKEKYLDPQNTKEKLHDMREKRKTSLEKLII